MTDRRHMNSRLAPALAVDAVVNVDLTMVLGRFAGQVFSLAATIPCACHRTKQQCTRTFGPERDKINVYVSTVPDADLKNPSIWHAIPRHHVDRYGRLRVCRHARLQNNQASGFPRRPDGGCRADCNTEKRSYGYPIHGALPSARNCEIGRRS